LGKSLTQVLAASAAKLTRISTPPLAFPLTPMACRSRTQSAEQEFALDLAPKVAVPDEGRHVLKHCVLDAVPLIGSITWASGCDEECCQIAILKSTLGLAPADKHLLDRAANRFGSR
jgi:hypothetical protein